MPELPITYDDVEVIEADGSGLTCRIGNARAFVGKYVPLEGTAVHRKGDRGRLVLPRWFVEQQALPLDRRMSEREVDEWVMRAELRLAAAQQFANTHPDDARAQTDRERATAALLGALKL